MKTKHVLKAACVLLLALPGHAQQIVCERLLTTPGLEVRSPTACAAPNGEFIVTGAARPIGTTTPTLATHTFVARLQATGCDTLWTRRLPHSAPYYNASSVRANAQTIWLLTPDTVSNITNAPPFKGVRLWQLTSSGQIQKLVRPTARSVREYLVNLLEINDGGVFVQLQNEAAAGGSFTGGILRYNNAGTLRWRRDYGLAANNRASGLCYTPTGHVLVAGTVGVGANYDAHAKLLEVETNRGDSLRGTTLPWGPNVTYEFVNSRNEQPLETIALRDGGGYVLPSLVGTPAFRQTGQLTRLDANYNVLWRYQLPTLPTPNAYNVFQQVRELADGTLLALVGSRDMQRTFWLYRFRASTGALLASYAFTPTTPAIVVGVAQLLPVAVDSTLLVVGGSRPSSTLTQVGPIYVARLRVPGLPRVVTPALPLAARTGSAAGLVLGLYPNPARDAVTIELPARPATGQLELRDALGRLVRTQPVGARPQVVRWPLAGLAPGLYAVLLRGPGGSGVRRLVVE